MARSPTTLDSGFDALPTIHDAPDDDREITPEQALWLAVVALCWADAFGITPYGQLYLAEAKFRRDESTMKPDSDAIEIDAYRAQCKNWLIQDFDPWREDRETCCDLAGLDPDMLRKAARRKLAAMKQAEAENRVAKVFEIDRMFAALVDRADRMDSDALDAALEALAALESDAA